MNVATTHRLFTTPRRNRRAYFIPFFFFETNDVAPLWLSPVDSLLSHTGLIVYVYDGKRFNRNYTSKRRKPNKYTHKTDRTKKERKKVCVIIIFSLLVFGFFFFFGLSGQMIDKCKFFFLVDIPPSLSLLPSTHTHASSLLSVFFHL